MPGEPLIDPGAWRDREIEVAIDGVREVNPQRDEMEQIDGILGVEDGVCVARRDVRDDEFWVRGHIPGRPVFPGVLLCEAAAQTASYLIKNTVEAARGKFIGLAGFEAVKFRGQVAPGDRVVIAARLTNVRSRQAICYTQAFVGERMVFEGTVVGMGL